MIVFEDVGYIYWLSSRGPPCPPDLPRTAPQPVSLHGRTVPRGELTMRSVFAILVLALILVVHGAPTPDAAIKARGEFPASRTGLS